MEENNFPVEEIRKEREEGIKLGTLSRKMMAAESQKRRRMRRDRWMRRREGLVWEPHPSIFHLHVQIWRHLLLSPSLFSRPATDQAESWRVALERGVGAAGGAVQCWERKKQKAEETSVRESLIEREKT